MKKSWSIFDVSSSLPLREPPEAFSLRMIVHPALRRRSCWIVRSWPSELHLAYPIFATHTVPSSRRRMSPVRSWSRYWGWSPNSNLASSVSGQKAGIERAKAKGVYKGLKPTVPVEQVRAMHKDGVGPSAIARELGISRMSVHRALNAN